ncbi:hypothetical protein PFISCL1PPCAC_28744, partial [Pristionchus fissidentatus]
RYSMSSSPSSSIDETALACKENLKASLKITDALAASGNSPPEQLILRMNEVLQAVYDTNFSEESRQSIRALYDTFIKIPSSMLLDCHSTSLMHFARSFAVVQEESIRQITELRRETNGGGQSSASSDSNNNNHGAAAAAPATAPSPSFSQQRQHDMQQPKLQHLQHAADDNKQAGGSFSWAQAVEDEGQKKSGSGWDSLPSHAQPSIAHASAANNHQTGNGWNGFGSTASKGTGSNTSNSHLMTSSVQQQPAAGAAGFAGFASSAAKWNSSGATAAAAAAAASTTNNNGFGPTGNRWGQPAMTTRSRSSARSPSADAPIARAGGGSGNGWSHPPSRRSSSRAPSVNGRSSPASTASALASSSRHTSIPPVPAAQRFACESAMAALNVSDSVTPASTGQALLMTRGEGFGTMSRRRDRSKSIPPRPAKQPNETLDYSPDAIKGRINITHVSRSVNVAELRAFLEPIDLIMELRYPKSESGNHHHGFAFCKFESNELADTAVAQLHGAQLGGKNVSVKRAEFWFKDDAAAVSYTRRHRRGGGAAPEPAPQPTRERVRERMSYAAAAAPPPLKDELEKKKKEQAVVEVKNDAPNADADTREKSEEEKDGEEQQPVVVEAELEEVTAVVDSDDETPEEREEKGAEAEEKVAATPREKDSDASDEEKKKNKLSRVTPEQPPVTRDKAEEKSAETSREKDCDDRDEEETEKEKK